MKFSAIIAFLLSAILVQGAEGMYPINQVKQLPLKKAGLKISADQIFNAKGEGIVEAVVQLGGCTGSFISDKGLIITNHHCAFSSLGNYATADNHLFEKGYLAPTQEKELQMKGLTCRIMRSNDDVSAEALLGADTIANALRKRAQVSANLIKIKTKESAAHPEYQIEISEMLPLKSYVVFRYLLIKDIRIVFIPARNIGEFGGETDNWAWPRHTGDFSLVRAYVGKDGKPADYSAENIPYKPSKVLTINAGGVKENDFVFIPGYPGRTYRNQPSAFLKHEQQYTLPFISGLFDWEINTIKSLGSADPNYLNRNEGKIKRLANTMKNYRGKLKTMQRIDLVKSSEAQEQQWLKVFEKTPPKYKQMFNVLSDIRQDYQKEDETYLKNLWYTQLYRESLPVMISSQLNVFLDEYKALPKNSEKRTLLVKSAYDKLRGLYRQQYPAYDSLVMNHFMAIALNMEGTNRPEALKSYRKQKYAQSMPFSREIYTPRHLMDSSYVFKLMNSSVEKLTRLKEPFISFERKLRADYMSTDSLQQGYKAQLDALLPVYVDLKMESNGSDFIPDANGTLRLTYGNIKGYAPADATYFMPFTTVKGMVEKNGMEPDYVTNSDVIALLKKNQFGAYKLSNKDDLPLCMLYNTDTTGGNSGSPVLNDEGELVALNFDRTFDATINDYAWNDSYSRSIGLDIRFVLWTTAELANADYLIKEMKIKR